MPSWPVMPVMSAVGKGGSFSREWRAILAPAGGGRRMCRGGRRGRRRRRPFGVGIGYALPAMTINQPPAPEDGAAQHIEIGILTKGKPTLGMVLANLLMQDLEGLQILIVDTSETPVINREDVLFALKLSQDRHIRCDYQRSRDK